MSNKPIVSHFDGNRYAYVCDYLKGLETEKPLVVADVGAGSSIVREECENDRLQFHEFDLQNWKIQPQDHDQKKPIALRALDRAQSGTLVPCPA